MSFKTRKIREKPRKRPIKKAVELASHAHRGMKKLPPKTKNYVIASVLVIFGVFVVFKVTMGAYSFVTGFSPKNLLLAIGSDLEKDGNNYTNILLLGDGGSERDGADLIDTIMVASIDYEKNAVSLLSVPRDYYVEKDVELNVLYGEKINELYRNNKNLFPDKEERYQQFKNVVGRVVNLDIQYYVRLDFNAFVEIVDSLGGITVDVQESIYDPYYPNETDDGYTIFEVEKGITDMDGETALKFVRSRKTTSDFDRAARQQLVLDSVQQKALSGNVLTSPGKLKGLYTAVQDNINTDMSLRELIAMAGFAKQMDRSRVVRKVIHDDPGQEGGFLYTPERELYNGQFVLLPFGDDLEMIYKYADLIFNQREMYYDSTRIEILNATGVPGIARNAAYQLIRFGFDIVEIENYYNEDGEKEYLEQSRIEYYDWTETGDGLMRPKYQSTLNALDGFVKAKDVASDRAYLVSDEKSEKVYEGGRVNFSIILGNDYDVYNVN